MAVPRSARLSLQRLLLLSLLAIAAAGFAAPAALAQAPPPGSCPGDADCDGRPDTQDACPTETGYGPSGCPDRDGDQVPDKDDPCPDVRGDPSIGPDGQQIPGACPDEDHDGVADAQDKCPHTGGIGTKVDAQGCGPFSARVLIFAKDLNAMGKDPDIHGQCQDSAGDSCTVRLTLMLNPTSARRLRVAREIVDRTFKLDRSTFAGKYRYAIPKNVLSTKVVRAFKRAYARNIPVTMTLSGSYVRGSGDSVKFPKSTFTLRRKPPSRSQEPSVTNGDDGPSSTGVTRSPPDPDDF